MTKAEEIFEKHIGLNAEMGYEPIKKEDVIAAINEAMRQAVLDYEIWLGNPALNYKIWLCDDYSPEEVVDEYLKQLNKE